MVNKTCVSSPKSNQSVRTNLLKDKIDLHESNSIDNIVQDKRNRNPVLLNDKRISIRFRCFLLCGFEQGELSRRDRTEIPVVLAY